MAFEKAEQKTPTSIGRLTIIVVLDEKSIDVDGTITTKNSVSYDVEVLDQNEERVRCRGDIGDLISLLSDTEKTQIMAFMQAQKDKAVAGFLQ